MGCEVTLLCRMCLAHFAAPCANKTIDGAAAAEAMASLALACSTDVPAHVTAEPRCALQQKTPGGQLVDYCVLVCSPDA